MSFVHQLSPSWPTDGFKGIKNLVVFGDSYSSVGYDSNAPHPTPTRPLGVPYPGTELWTDDEVDDSLHPNWVGHLISKYSPGKNYEPSGSSESSILVYDYAVGGQDVAGLLRQIKSEFMPHVGVRPDWAAWSPSDTLFVSWVGINDLASTSNPSHPLKMLLRAQEDLYEVGARNFLFIDVPPIDRSPAVIVLQFVNPGDDSTMPRYQEWNDGLKSSIAAFASSHPEVSALYFSSHQTFSRILDEPRQHGFTEEQAEKKMGRGIWADHLHPTSEMHDFVAKDLTSFLASVVAE